VTVVSSGFLAEVLCIVFPGIIPSICGVSRFCFLSVAVFIFWSIRAWKVAPALAMGCTIVMKPSELTPLTALVGRYADYCGFDLISYRNFPSLSKRLGKQTTARLREYFRRFY
jgi:hypothetical protein